MKRVRGLGWYVSFTVLAVIAFVVVYYFTGRDALGATARLVWNGIVFAFNAAMRFSGGILEFIARGIGMRRVARLGTVIAGVGLGYAGSLLLGDKGVHAALDWRHKLVAFFAAAGARWRALALWVKLLVVAVLIASQIYLHTMLILFPIAFLVPVVRMMWVQASDFLFGSWYWKHFGHQHRSLATRLRRMPITRSIVGGVRLMRIRYLCAWRLWRYDPHYRIAGSRGRRVNFVEPVQLWRRGELDRYVGHPLLAGTASAPPGAQAATASGAAAAHPPSQPPSPPPCPPSP
jgi:hypothetical protein